MDEEVPPPSSIPLRVQLPVSAGSVSGAVVATVTTVVGTGVGRVGVGVGNGAGVVVHPAINSVENTTSSTRNNEVFFIVSPYEGYDELVSGFNNFFSKFQLLEDCKNKFEKEWGLIPSPSCQDGEQCLDRLSSSIKWNFFWYRLISAYHFLIVSVRFHDSLD